MTEKKYSQTLHSTSQALTANPLPVRSKSLPPKHLNSCAVLWPAVRTLVVVHYVGVEVGDSCSNISTATLNTTTGEWYHQLIIPTKQQLESCQLSINYVMSKSVASILQKKL